MTLKVCIFGVSGYTGSKLLSYLDKHRKVEIVGVFGSSNIGVRLREAFPNLSMIPDIEISDFKLFNFDKVDLVFSCLPHGEFQKNIISKLKKGLSIIDLSGDFRIENKPEYEKFYDTKHETYELKSEFTYGLTEIYKDEISNSKKIANPGCYPTSILIPIIPLLKEKIIKGNHIIIDSKSGVSGAGKKLVEQNMFSELQNNFFSYSTNSHKHFPEIKQEVNKFNKDISLTFIPHLLPIFSGIQSNIYIDKENTNVNLVFDFLKSYFVNERFVKVQKDKIVKLSDVQDTNNIIINVFQDIEKKIIIITSSLDNLIKGAAGQAIQNMNLMFDFEESESLI